MKSFAITDLFKLNLRKEAVPSYGNTHRKQYPETIPLALIGFCIVNSLLKLAVPLVLEEVYSRMSGPQLEQ
jgi:ABC-type multidrug transport system fused ATPase/permease subunit